MDNPQWCSMGPLMLQNGTRTISSAQQAYFNDDANNNWIFISNVYMDQNCMVQDSKQMVFIQTNNRSDQCSTTCEQGFSDQMVDCNALKFFCKDFSNKAIMTIVSSDTNVGDQDSRNGCKERSSLYYGALLGILVLSQSFLILC